MENVGLVSVVVPIYNTENYLDACIRSIIFQSYKEIEIILVNDGSIDNSKQIMESWKHKDCRIRCVHKENQGVTRAREDGVKYAHGNWIMFVDSDDCIPPLAIETLVCKVGDCGIIIGNVEVVGRDGWPFVISNREMSRLQYLKILLSWKKIHWGPVARLYKKDLFSEKTFDIPKVITNGEDYLMNLRLGCKAEKIMLVDDVVYKYVFRTDSAMSKRPFRSVKYTFLFIANILKSLSGFKKYLLVDIVRCIGHRLKMLVKFKLFG